MADEKEIRWVGSSYDDLLAFPKVPRKEAGFQLGKVQAGFDPTDWKAFDEIGEGSREIRISDAKGIFRVMYVAKFEEAVTSCTASRRRRKLRRSRTRTRLRRAIAP